MSDSVLNAARFAHWLDLHHMVCNKKDCKLCAKHTAELESADQDLWAEFDKLAP